MLLEFRRALYRTDVAVVSFNLFGGNCAIPVTYQLGEAENYVFRTQLIRIGQSRLVLVLYGLAAVSHKLYRQKFGRKFSPFRGQVAPPFPVSPTFYSCTYTRTSKEF